MGKKLTKQDSDLLKFFFAVGAYVMIFGIAVMLFGKDIPPNYTAGFAIISFGVFIMLEAAKVGKQF